MADLVCTDLDVIRQLRELGATSIEFHADGRMSKVTFAVQAQAVVAAPRPATKATEPAEGRRLSTEEIKDALRRKELLGR